MDLGELVGKMKALKLREIRFDLSDYFECVIDGANQQPLEGVLRAFFGEPAKKKGVSLTGESEALMREFGGVRQDQILYLTRDSELGLYAMIWPWGDGQTVTVKIEKIQIP